MALAKILLQKEVISEDEVIKASEELDRDGEATASHLLICAIAEAAAPEPSEWEAERARARFHVIEGDKG